MTPLALHLHELRDALDAFGAAAAPLAAWGERLACTLGNGGRLLAAGNGGSAAEAHHLTAELIGRMRDERMPLSALALTGDPSAMTAISNDYGYEEMFARQVRGHGRSGDVLIVLSTSGRSPNLLAAVAAARCAGMTTWALTGPQPNPLAEACDAAIRCPGVNAQVVQELHLVCVHVLCEHIDAALPAVLAAQQLKPDPTRRGGHRAASARPR
jgi:D-sedoheptulose 7-phosphate isomerase